MELSKMRCHICGINELIHEDELDTGICRDCQSSLMVDNDIGLFDNT